MIGRKAVRAASAALFLSWAFTAVAADDPGEEILRKVAAKYSAVKSFSANFRQEVPLQNLGIVRKASGKVFFARPLRMKWDYRGKDAQIFLADGEHLYFRPADSPQVFRRKLDEKGLGGRVPLLLLFGKGEITELFRVEHSISRKDGAEAALRLVPRGDGAPEVRRVDLVVGTADFVLREIHIYDRLGGSNHLYLDGTEFDPAVPGGMFRFRRPPGVEVVDG